MALSDGELDKIKLVLRTELEPLDHLVRQHHQSLYGAEGNNGINKNVKELMKFRWIVTGALLIIGSATFWQIIRIVEKISIKN